MKILATFLSLHNKIKVNANCVSGDKNYDLREKLMFLGLPAPLFTIEMNDIPREAFQRFFDCLEPTFGHMITLGQTNTIVSCPGLTTHSELNEQQQKEAGICKATIRFAVGNENPVDLVRHLRATAVLAVDPLVPGYSFCFPSEAETEALIESCYTEAHQKYIKNKLAK